MKENGSIRHDDAVEQKIEHALSALRDAEPGPGLSGRILASLEQRATMPERARLAISGRFALWTTAAAAVIAIASLMVFEHHRSPASDLAHSPQPQVRSKVPESARLQIPQVSRSQPGFGSPEGSTEPTHRKAHRSIVSGKSMPARCAQSGCPTQHDGPAVVADAVVTDPDAQALADLHAPSHPAPPLPLTKQEKLLLRTLRYGNLTQLAELNPDVRAKQDADETASFEAFFPEPPPLKQPLGDTE